MADTIVFSTRVEPDVLERFRAVVDRKEMSTQTAVKAAFNLFINAYETINLPGLEEITPHFDVADIEAEISR